MTIDIKNQKSLAVALAKAGARYGGNATPIIKLTKLGEWVVGAENAPVKERRFAANVFGVLCGYVCFADGTVIDEVLRPVALDHPISLDELPDHSPYSDGGGWKETMVLELRSISTGNSYLYKPLSQGGHAAICELLTKTSSRLAQGEFGIPIIDLAVSSYFHPRFGKVFTPVMEIASWEESAGLEESAVEKLDDELPDEDPPF